MSPAARAGFSRMTITCSGDPAILEQMIKQLAKLVDVVRAVDHTHDDAYETEIALVKVRCPQASAARCADRRALRRQGGRLRRDSVVLRVYGSSEKLDAMTALLDGFDIAEIVRTGNPPARGVETT